jgi:hypothetical protein
VRREILEQIAAIAGLVVVVVVFAAMALTGRLQIAAVGLQRAADVTERDSVRQDDLVRAGTRQQRPV